jgi:hypothetical protein
LIFPLKAFRPERAKKKRKIPPVALKSVIFSVDKKWAEVKGRRGERGKI